MCNSSIECQFEFIGTIKMTQTTSFETLATKIHPYMKFFFWLGQGPSPNIRTPRKSSIRSRMVQLLPASLFLLAHALLFLIGAVLQNFYRKTYGKTNNAIANVYLFTEITTNIAIYSQFFFNRDVLTKAVQEFNEVAQMIRGNFGCSLELSKPFCRTRVKMFCILITYIVDSCIYFLPTLHVSKKLQLSVLFDVLQSATAVSSMHSILYINVLNFYMKTLNKTLKNHSMASGIHHTMGDDQAVFLNKIKMVHFRLWTIAQKINQFFGCGLVVVLLRNFVDTTFGIYWAFLIINNRGTVPIIQLIRTYCARLCHSVLIHVFFFFLFRNQGHCAVSPAQRSHQF